MKSGADEVALQMLAVLLVRIERAAAHLDRVDRELVAGGDPALAFELRRDLRGWLNAAGRLCGALGLTLPVLGKPAVPRVVGFDDDGDVVVIEPGSEEGSER